MWVCKLYVCVYVLCEDSGEGFFFSFKKEEETKVKSRHSEEIRSPDPVISRFICGDLSFGCVCFHRVSGSLIREVRGPVAVYRPAYVREPVERKACVT